MSRKWTPQQFIIRRRIRIITCASLIALSMITCFLFTARKSVALTVNGETRQVTTYAFSVETLLKQQGIKRKTHDLVEVSSGGRLTNHSSVTVQSAYQITLNIDGSEVPFWTTATSADQLLGFFEVNRRDAAKVRIDVKNVYNQLTGGLSINQNGPVTVIADNKQSIAPNGKLPATSILDSKGIVLGKDDRVSVEKEGEETILRVQRVVRKQSTVQETIPFATRTVVDNSLAPGQTVIYQQGKNGQKTQTLLSTFVDGVEESSTLIKEEISSQPIDQVIAVGPEKPITKPSPSPSTGENTADNNAEKKKENKQESNKSDSKPSKNKQNPQQPQPTQAPSKPARPNKKPTQTPAPTPSQPTEPTPPRGLWHPTASQAQDYARGAARQRGWTDQQFEDLKKLWDKESSWRWSAENPSSGAYGIPQALPPDKMGQFGQNWRDDAAVQIDWGLFYIADRYGSPTAAWNYWKRMGWY